MYYAAIQLYSTGLVPETTLMCQTAGDKEFPRHISFYDDGQAMLYSNNKTIGMWKRGLNGWTETPLGNLEAKVTHTALIHHPSADHSSGPWRERYHIDNPDIALAFQLQRPA